MNFDIANKSIITPVEDQTEEVMDATAEDLQRFVMAGGSIDFGTWSQLNSFSKDCLVAAAYEWRVEFAYIIAKGITEDYGPEHIWSMLDGGEALKDKVADEIVDEAARKAAESLENEHLSGSTADTVQAEAGNVAGDE